MPVRNAQRTSLCVIIPVLLLTSCVHAILNPGAELDTVYTRAMDESQTDIYSFPLASSSPEEYVIAVHVRKITTPEESPYPIFVVVKQERTLSAFQVPIMTEYVPHMNVSRMMCPIIVNGSENDRLIVELSTSSPVGQAVRYIFEARRITRFNLSLNTPLSFMLFPAQPVYFRYMFDEKVESVNIRAVSPDNTCMIFSLQTLQCPVTEQFTSFDTSGFYQSVAKLGSISANRFIHGNGVYVVVALSDTDFVCDLAETVRPPIRNRARLPRIVSPRAKNVTISVHVAPNGWNYILPIFCVIGFYLMFYLVAIMVICTCSAWETGARQQNSGQCSTSSPQCPPDLSTYSSLTHRRMSLSDPDQPNSTHIHVAVLPITNSDNTTTVTNLPLLDERLPDLVRSAPTLVVSSPSGTEVPPYYRSMLSTSDEDDDYGDGDDLHSLPRHDGPATSSSHATATVRRQVSLVQSTSSLVHTDDMSSQAAIYIDNRRTPVLRDRLYVSDLSQKRFTTLNRKYVLYFWYLIIISIFYGLPAVQLIMNYQKTLMLTGNEDMCYFNFECARPLGSFLAFNNVISNIGFLMLGTLFLILTARRDHKQRVLRKFLSSKQLANNRGIPEYYGIFYAMGFGLIMEGVMSAGYHICPSFSNFQFDTAYMYILAILILVKIYQIRHPDINATAHSVYMVVAAVIFSGVLGVLYSSEAFWVAFTAFFITLSIILTAEIYYMGQWNVDLFHPRRVYLLIRADGFNCLRPLYTERMVLLFAANLVNISLAIYGIAVRPNDFSSFLLGIFMINDMMYTVFYLVFKLKFSERLSLNPLLYMLASVICGIPAVYFFMNRVSSWDLSPAQSRSQNRPCILFNFFDSHDVWHMLSSTSLFFSFMMLMYLDDDLAEVPRNRIRVF